MPSNVTPYNIPVPGELDPVDVPADLNAMATAVGTALDGRLPLNSTLYHPGMRSGRYYGIAAGGSGAAPTQSQLRCYPIIVPNSVTIDRIGADVVTGAVGSTVRLGIYENDPTTDYPGDLVIDAGTIDGNTTGFQEITISQALTPGIYWLAAVSQGGAPTVRVSGFYYAPWLTPGQTSAIAAASNAVYRTRGSVTGALPDPAATAGSTTQGHIIQVRIA